MLAMALISVLKRASSHINWSQATIVMMTNTFSCQVIVTEFWRLDITKACLTLNHIFPSIDILSNKLRVV